MQIIKRGVPPEDRIWRGNCTRCGTIAEAEHRELSAKSDVRGDTWAEAKCPVCASTFNLYPKPKNG